MLIEHVFVHSFQPGTDSSTELPHCNVMPRVAAISTRHFSVARFEGQNGGIIPAGRDDVELVINAAGPAWDQCIVPPVCLRIRYSTDSPRTIGSAESIFGSRICIMRTRHSALAEADWVGTPINAPSLRARPPALIEAIQSKAPTHLRSNTRRFDSHSPSSATFKRRIYGGTAALSQPEGMMLMW
jgi:hypothetical protein